MWWAGTALAGPMIGLPTEVLFPASEPLVSPGAVGVLEACDGSPGQLAAVTDALERAEQAMAVRDSAKAREQLDQADRLLTCLDEPAPANLAARPAYLRGVDAATAGEPEQAARHFEAARVLDPGITWDNAYSPDLRPTFTRSEAAWQALGEVPLQVLPAAAVDAVWIGGRPASEVATVRAGRHLVQVDTPTGWHGYRLVASDEPLTLLVAHAVPTAVKLPPGPDDPLTEVLAETLPPGTRLTLSEGSEQWTTTLDGADWARVEAPVRPGRTVAVAGIATGAAGAALLTYGAIAGARSQALGDAAIQDDDYDGYLAASGRSDAAAGQRVAGAVLVGVGCAGVGVSAFLDGPVRDALRRR